MLNKVQSSLCLLLLASSVVSAGPLAGVNDIITDINVTNTGSSWVNLVWLVDAGIYEIHKFKLVVNDDLTEEEQCFNVECSMNVTYLDPCTEHKFSLAVFVYDPAGGSDLESTAQDVYGTTLESLPGEPQNVAFSPAPGTGVLINWTEPLVNPACVDSYKVCMAPVGSEDITCETTTDRFIKGTNLEACGEYHAWVSAVTPTGIEGPAVESTTTMPEQMPGKVQNLNVSMVSSDSIRIEWDNPIINPLCVDSFAVTYGETHTKVAKSPTGEPTPYQEHHATISDLAACTNFTVSVEAITIGGKRGPSEESYANTEETTPTSVSNIWVNPDSQTSITAWWEPPFGDNCVDSYKVCLHDEGTVIDECQVVTADVKNVTATGLSPCTSYEVYIYPMSPSGVEGNRTYNSSRTDDVAPGEPQDLVIIDATTDTIIFGYEPPLDNPQCANEYDNEIIDMEQPAKTKNSERQAKSTIENTFRGLDACTDYQLKVRAVSIQNLHSDWKTENSSTLEVAPSVSRDFQVVSVTDTSLTAKWFIPENNPACVGSYILQWSGSNLQTGQTNIVSPSPSQPLPSEVQAIIPGLTPCIKYDLTVTAYSPSMAYNGPPATTSDTTTGCP